MDNGTPKAGVVVDRSADGSPPWAEWPDEKLLDVRLCDLDLRIEGSFLEERTHQLYRELDERGIGFRPHIWLSDDWFTPDDVPGIAAPFYLAHPRLAELERSQMLEVEGGTPEWCMRILRHETGHAIDNAYCLRRRRRRQRLFGRSSEPYPECYAPRPYSKSYVVHLESWYAQSHPDEDFAETLAVWLTPDSQWPKRYASWPALKKLEYVEELMKELADKKPVLATRRKVSPLHRIRKTLRRHYQAKRDLYEVELPATYDRDLRRLFSSSSDDTSKPTAAAFLSRMRKGLRKAVARRTGVYQYTVDQVLGEMIKRCRQLGLRLSAPEEESRFEFAILLTLHTVEYLHSGRYRLAL